MIHEQEEKDIQIEQYLKVKDLSKRDRQIFAVGVEANPEIFLNFR